MTQHRPATLRLRLYGPFTAQWSDGRVLRVRGAKAQALIALLAASPGMVRSRGWLIAALWGRVGQSQGRASLRQALFNLRRMVGEPFADLFDVAPDRIGLKPEAVEIEGGPGDGEFLEGIDVPEEGFEDWLRTARQLPGEPVVAIPRADGKQHRIALKPRIAILPLLVTGDAAEPHLGDAIAQELIRAMSKSQLVEMISHLSSRRVDPRQIDMAALSELLSADHFVTGRCHLDGRRLLVEIDAHNAVSATMLWSGTFDTSFESFVTSQTGVVHEIASAILQALISTAVELGASRPMPNLETHELLMSGIALMHHMRSGSFEWARVQIAEATKRVPRHSVPRAWLAQWHLLRAFQGWSLDPAADHASAREAISRALDANPQCALSLAIAGNIQTVIDGDFEAARRSFDAATAVNASSPMTCQLQSILHSFLGEGEAAVALTERTRRLSPCDPRGHFFDALGAAAYLTAGRYDTAIELAESALRMAPRHVSAMRAKVVAQVLMGDRASAKESARRLLEIEPKLTVEGYAHNHPAAHLETGRRWAEALGRAGIPAR